MTPLCQHLLLSMSSTPTSYELNNADCEKGHVTQRPPILYAVSKNGPLVSTLQETIKIKTPEGESKQSLLGDGADGEEYVKHLMSFFHFMEKKGYKADLEAASKVTLGATTALKKLAKAQHGEKDPAKAERLTRVEAAKVRLIKAKVAESMLACLTYDLFCKLLRDEPKIQWDWIVTDMHTKNPWEDIKGVKHNSLRGKLQQSLMDCIEFHKLTVFTVDAVERLRYYLMCSVKKPVRWTILMCWLPYPQNYITGNTPYGTGNATHTGNVRCPYQYYTPHYFTSFLANALRYVPIQSWYCYHDTRCQFRYGNQENYSTGTVIATKDVSTSMVIHKITVPVLSLQRKTSFPVW